MQSRLSPEGCVQCQENGESHEACQAPKSILCQVDFGPTCTTLRYTIVHWIGHLWMPLRQSICLPVKSTGAWKSRVLAGFLGWPHTLAQKMGNGPPHPNRKRVDASESWAISNWRKPTIGPTEDSKFFPSNCYGYGIRCISTNLWCTKQLPRNNSCKSIWHGGSKKPGDYFKPTMPPWLHLPLHSFETLCYAFPFWGQTRLGQPNNPPS